MKRERERKGERERERERERMSYGEKGLVGDFWSIASKYWVAHGKVAVPQLNLCDQIYILQVK